MLNSIKSLRIGDLTARIPIIQGGMGVGISMSGLAAAVANQGGIGVIATAGIGMDEPDFYRNFAASNMRALREEIRKARQATSGILGVNIMVALTNFADMVKTAIEEKIDVIFSGAGLPLNLPKYRPPDSNTKLVPIVSSGRAATTICKRWQEKYDCLPDALVVEGPKAGGHLGFKYEQLSDPNFALENLVTDVIEAVKPFETSSGKQISVIAAGGVYTGADIHKFFELGASGVQMGTRFVATDECDAADDFKQTYIDAREEDIRIIKSPVGLPGRVIRNSFVDAMERGEKEPFRCPYHCIVTCDFQHSPYCIALALMNAKRGNLKHGFPFAGENAHRVDKIVPVKELMDSLVKEYLQAVAHA
ncbi:MAG: nitronate monooxygenase [Calditrichaeota bacterium]|nr:nitronate monooxygenase [Calditrichota bacterium]MCB9368622.1 nitronate monooxygenase [Calditrichota bacterium]